MPFPVQIYVYDLTQGLARMLSQNLLGTRIDGVWVFVFGRFCFILFLKKHTSVVVYGSEYFYGQGIMEEAPGTTHHGSPLEKLEIGSTEVKL